MYSTHIKVLGLKGGTWTVGGDWVSDQKRSIHSSLNNVQCVVKYDVVTCMHLAIVRITGILRACMIHSALWFRGRILFINHKMTAMQLQSSNP